MLKPVHLFVLLLLFCSPVMAGTIVEIQNNDELTTAITDGEKIRMDMSASEYIVVDYRDHSVNVINPQKQQVMFLNAKDMAAGNNAALVKMSIKPLGNGQAIAGYKTQKFSYLANGRTCGVIYGSMNAYQEKGVKELLQAMKAMMEKQRAALGGFASLVDDCTLADMQLIDHVNTVGLPMRTEKNGRVELEVKAIKVDVALPDDTFLVPASYKMLGAKKPLNTVSTDDSKQQQQHEQQRQHERQRQQAQNRQSRQPSQQSWPQRSWQQGPRVMQRYPRPGY